MLTQRKEDLCSTWNLPSAQKGFLETLKDLHPARRRHKRGPVVGSGNGHAWESQRSLDGTRRWELRAEQAGARHQAHPERLAISCFLSSSQGRGHGRLIRSTAPGAGVTQTVKNLPARQETQVQALGQKDPLQKEMATHFSILAWKNPKNRGVWQAPVHGVAKNRIWLSD